MDRILARFRSWASRALSKSGHLQLVRYVLQSFQVYWASVFVLPIRVVHEVESVLRAFLWSGDLVGRGGVKV